MAKKMTAKNSSKHNRYMLIDGNALIHRGFHAIPNLSTKSGELTNAVYGFTSILLRAIEDLEPTHIGCSFDLAGPTFRHNEYADYKATRTKTAQELYDQIPRIKQVVRNLNIPIFEAEGFEADDVLGTLAKKICQEHKDDCEVMIVTGDLDTLQLVNDCVKIYTLKRGLTDIAIYDTEAVKERYNLRPDQLIDYRALKGDPSDNIKGVKGIGEKTASDLICEFGSLEGLYKAVRSNTTGSMTPRVLKLLKADEASAKLSQKLSEIVCNVPLEGEIEKYNFSSENLKDVLVLFKDLEFKSLAPKLPKRYLSVKDQVEIETIQVKSSTQFTQDYQFVNTKEKLDKLLALITKSKILALDTETDNIDPVQANLVGVSMAVKSGQAFYVPADLFLSSEKLRKILEDEKVLKVGHNIKYDAHVFLNSEVILAGIGFDTMIASYLLNAGSRQHGLSTCAFNEFGYQMQPIEDLIGKGKAQITMDKVAPEKVSWYACEDVDFTLRLYEIYSKQLQKQGLIKIFEEIEMPLVPVLLMMEHTGIELDVELMSQLSERARKEIDKLEANIYKLAGEEFNIKSPKQMQDILFQKLAISKDGGKKIKTGISTAAGQLERMVDTHPIIAKILAYREVTKLQSTYLKALPKLVNPKTNRIHTSYNQTIAATGRLSSVDPNLQNIPVRGDGLGSEVRKAFIAGDGFELLALDYSQIELRIVAHLADDKAMKKVFKDKGDIHSTTAQAIFGVKEKDLTADMRRDAKTINFGVLYGLSSFGLSSRIGEVSPKDAKHFIDKYFQTYPGVEIYLEGVKAEVREHAEVKNQLDRVRKFPEITSSAYFVRQAAERAAINFPIQSLSADIIKLAMIEVGKEIIGREDEIRMLLQVHDELVFEVKQGSANIWAKNIKPIMEKAIKLTVPVIVEAKSGKNWGEMKKLGI